MDATNPLLLCITINMPRYTAESDLVLRAIQAVLVEWNGETLASGLIEEGQLITGYREALL